MENDDYTLDASAAPLTNTPTRPVRLPAGLSAVTSGQFVIAVLLLLSVAVLARPSASQAAADWLIALCPSAVFFVAAVGLSLRRGWGWWLTCTIYFQVLCSVPASIALATLHQQPVQFRDYVLKLLVSVLTVAYLNRPEPLRFFRFQTPDGQPSRLTLISPLVAGCLAAIAGFAIALANP